MGKDSEKILGPTLFILYTQNLITNFQNNLQTTMYADDVALLFEEK